MEKKMNLYFKPLRREEAMNTIGKGPHTSEKDPDEMSFFERYGIYQI